MKRLKFVFLAVVFLCLASCEQEDSINNPDQFNEVNQSNNFNYPPDNCVDEIEQKYTKYGMRSYLYKIINEEIPAARLSEYGTPKYTAIITEELVNSNNEIYALSLVPFFNETKNETSTIMVFNSRVDRGEYFLMEKESIENSSTFEIEIDPVNPSLRLSKEDLILMFNHFDCYINCEFDDLSTRGPECPTWGTSWWTKFTRWLGGIFGGGSSGGTFVPGWDIGGPWDNWGTGSTDVPPNTLSDSGNGPLNPSFQDAIWLLQMDCDPDEDDIDGAGLGGIENGLIEDDVVNPTALAIHKQWCYFKEKCMSDDFSGYQPLVPPIFYNSNHWENPYYQVGQFFSENSELFIEMLDLGYGCVSVDELELMKCISDKYDEFIETYDIELSDSEENSLKKALMDNENCEDNPIENLLFSNLTEEEKTWLNSPSNFLHKSMILGNLIKYKGDALAEEFINDHIDRLISDAEYASFVTSTMGWNGIMWSIAKELIGDKAVDLAFQLIPGFGQANEVRDAFKAAKNGDWVEFFVETSKIIAKETPWGKWIKTLDIANDLLIFYKKVEKIWDKVGTYAENVIESMWDIVKTFPKSIRTNTDIIGGIAKTIKRGLKSIDDMTNYAINIGAPYIKNSTVRHVLRGSNGGGVHHISAIVSDPDTYKIHKRVPTSNGCYKAEVWKNGIQMTPDKDFFPDDWDEFKVIDAIKGAYNDPDIDHISGNIYDGVYEGITVRMYINNIGTSDAKIISAFPQ